MGTSESESEYSEEEEEEDDKVISFRNDQEEQEEEEEAEKVLQLLYKQNDSTLMRACLIVEKATSICAMQQLGPVWGVVTGIG